MKQKQMKRVCLLIAGILFLLLFFSFSGIEKTKLLDTDGRNFEKAEVTKVISGNLSNSGSGKQTVELKLLSGDHKGKTIEATSSQSYLFGAKCKKGMKVIAIVNESNGEFVASVYSVNRGPMVWLMAAIFVAIVVAVGGRKGISSILSLVFTMLCIFFIFLPMIYKGISPILAVTMCMVDGITKKSVAAMLGTVIGVVFSGAFALIFGQVTSITGYNVSDIENLVYVGEMTDIKIGELLFAGILIASLGAVMDVGMSIASTLNELKEQNPQMMTKELFQSGMNVGRDMMGTMTNTLILAFTGGSINTLVFIFAYNYEYQQVINMYSVGIEIMQGLSSSLGVIMAVPVTSWIAAFLYSKNQK
jgi:uncharacterized membrane protein